MIANLPMVIIAPAISLFGMLGSMNLLAELSRGQDRIELIAGGDVPEVGIAAKQAQLQEPFGAEWDPRGELWIVEMSRGNRLLKVDGTGKLQHLAGKFYALGKTNVSPAASPVAPKAANNAALEPLQFAFQGPHNLAVQSPEKIFIADTWNGKIAIYDALRQQLSQLDAFITDAEKARSRGPYCICLDPSGQKLFVADLQRVHVIDLPTGRSAIFAGNGEKGKPSDGAVAAESPLVDPRAVAPDRQGNVYILERGGNALRVVDREGRIRTVVNGSGRKGNSGDGGPAIEALMNGPKHLCIDREQRVIIADAENHLIRRYDPSSGQITRIAGTGKAGKGAIGSQPLECDLNRPHGVSVHPTTGRLLITDSYNDRILEIVPVGR
jgi:DNA-binding beta-propeller fold protein YncE